MSLAVILASVVFTCGCDSGDGARGTGAAGSHRPAGHAAGTKVDGLPAPEKGSATLDGLFMVMKFNGRSYSPAYYFFTPAGYVYLGVPPGGLEGFDFAEAGKTLPGLTGAYTINGDKIAVKLANGKTREVGYAMKDNGEVNLDGVYAHKAGPFKPGTTFNGSYSGGAVASGGGTFAASSRTYAFRPDGTFEQSSLGSASVAARGTNVGASSSSSGGGTYRVAGNTLGLTHADGKVTKHTIFPYENYDKQIELNIDGSMYAPK